MKISAPKLWNSFRRDEKIALICCALALSFVAGFSCTSEKAAKPFFQNVAATPQKAIQVHVAGLVKRPGVYQVKSNARVNDAVFLAGGALPKAAVNVVNLAAPLRDGQKVEIPSVELKPVTQPAQMIPIASGDSIANSPIINVNTAAATELERLPQIGPAIAGRIIAHRQQHGAFSSLDDLEKVKGIGPKTIEKLEGKVSF
jgi:competence protein ComEA